jgi:hypothetical protein
MTMPEIGTATVKVVPQLEGLELVDQGIFDRIALAAHKHKVMISFTVTPYTENEETD